MATDEHEQRTVDGVPVKVGDVVWLWVGWGNVKQRKLDRVDLGMWWSMRSKEIFSTERAALDAALANQRQELKKTRQKVRSIQRLLERLTARSEELAPGGRK
jgi:hypothetical protein